MTYIYIFIYIHICIYTYMYVYMDVHVTDSSCRLVCAHLTLYVMSEHIHI